MVSDTTENLTNDPSALAVLLRAKGAAVTADGPEGLSISGIESREVGILAAGAGLTVYELSTQRASLEDAFMELTNEHAEFHAPQDTRAVHAEPAADVEKLSAA